MAFAIAGIVFVITLFLCLLQFLAAMNNPLGGNEGLSFMIGTFITGTVIAIAIAASHWLPHIGW